MATLSLADLALDVAAQPALDATRGREPEPLRLGISKRQHDLIAALQIAYTLYEAEQDELADANRARAKEDRKERTK